MTKLTYALTAVSLLAVSACAGADDASDDAVENVTEATEAADEMVVNEVDNVVEEVVEEPEAALPPPIAEDDLMIDDSQTEDVAGM